MRLRLGRSPSSPVSTVPIIPAPASLRQPAGVNWVISFAFVGLEVFTGAALIVLLFFLKVEKNLPKEQAEIKARHGKGASA